jgi:uncharacterized membrane protein
MITPIPGAHTADDMRGKHKLDGAADQADAHREIDGGLVAGAQWLAHGAQAQGAELEAGGAEGAMRYGARVSAAVASAA